MEDNNKLKKCAKCKKHKIISEFHKCKTGRMGLHNYCKICISKHKKQYIKDNKKQIKEYKRRPDVRERENKRERERYKNDPEYREKRLEQNRIRRRKEPAKSVQRLRYKTDISFRLKRTCQKRIQAAIKRCKEDLDVEVFKCAKTQDLIGCSISDLKIYLESLFKLGMTWENHGYGDEKWHIDHIIPCSAFDLTDPEQQKKCFHYSNLQPLWQKENLLKGNKII